MLLIFWVSSNSSSLKELYIYNLVLIDNFNITKVSKFFRKSRCYRKQMLLRRHSDPSRCDLHVVSKRQITITLTPAATY